MAEETAHHSHAMHWTLAVVGALLLYVLSWAPVECWKLKRGGTVTADGFYAPVYWLNMHTALREPLTSYYQWWLKRFGMGQDPFATRSNPHNKR